MDPRLLRYYNQELQHLREVGAEFAVEFPKVAGRLGIDGTEVSDPYVERLLEGFAFMAARVQLKIDAEFPRFTRHMLEAVMPHYLAPTPSMAVVRIAPDLAEGGLAEGFAVPRGSALRSQLGPDDKTACEYRTGHKLTLWPLEIAEAEYLPTAASIGNLGLPVLPRARAAIRLKLRTTAGLNFAKVALDTLSLYMRGSRCTSTSNCWRTRSASWFDRRSGPARGTRWFRPRTCAGSVSMTIRRCCPTGRARFTATG